jgi:hypothetical protein
VSGYIETPDSGKWLENFEELGGFHVVFPFRFKGHIIPDEVKSFDGREER